MRAGARKTGTNKEAKPIRKSFPSSPQAVVASLPDVAPQTISDSCFLPHSLAEELREQHIPGTIAYDIADVMKDLLDMAAMYLAVGGRLVFWLPTTNDYKEEDLPQHPARTILPTATNVASLLVLTNLVIASGVGLAELILDFFPKSKCVRFGDRMLPLVLLSSSDLPRLVQPPLHGPRSSLTSPPPDPPAPAMQSSCSTTPRSR